MTARFRNMLRLLRGVSGEISGAFGDLGTFLPYVIAVVGAGILAPTPVFLGFAAGYMIVAIVYRLPIAVQPMKALGAIIVTGGLSAAETAWAGAILGAILLALAASSVLDRAARALPQSVVSGLQVGLGLMLGALALDMMIEDWRIALPALAILALSFVWTRGPWVLVVLVCAVILVPATDLSTTLPTGAADGSVPAILSGILAQLPLTLLNAVVVAAAVTGSLYPGAARSATERKLATTSGLLNLVMAPMGGLPMCHGAGGIAAHHRFGARGYGAPLVMAACCAAAAFAGPTIVDVLTAIPAPVTGALLTYAAVDLVANRRVFDARPDCRPVIAATAFATFFWGALLGLVAGLAAEVIRVHIWRKWRVGSTNTGR